jgi:hypothetical protein
VSSAELVTGWPLSSWPVATRARSSTFRGASTTCGGPASYAEAVNFPLPHLAKAEQVYMSDGGQQKTLAAPYAALIII